MDSTCSATGESFEQWYLRHTGKAPTLASARYYALTKEAAIAKAAWLEPKGPAVAPGVNVESHSDTQRLGFVLREGAFIVWSLRDGTIRQCQLWAQNEDEEHVYLSGEHRFFDTERAAIDAAIDASADVGASRG
jgi:hypothetical protein